MQIHDLTEEQQARLKLLLRLDESVILQLEQVAISDARMKWFWSSARQFIGWVAAFIAGIVAFRHDIIALFKGGIQ